MSLAYTEPAAMLDESQYADHVERLLHEANWAWNTSLSLTQSAERSEPESVKVARRALELHATDGWRLRELDDLIRPRAFLTERPGQRPGKDEKAAMEAMTPAQFLRAFFEKGLPWRLANDDIVYAVLQAFAETHYGAGNMRAARQLNNAVVRALAVRAGMEPMTAELI